MEAKYENVRVVENALQYYNIKQYNPSSMWSVLYQWTSKKFPHIFLMIELSLSASYFDEIVERFFSLKKVVKSDWCSK